MVGATGSGGDLVVFVFLAMLIPSKFHTATASCSSAISNLQPVTLTFENGWPVVAAWQPVASGRPVFRSHAGAHAAMKTFAYCGDPTKEETLALQPMKVVLRRV
jgi:hypothetical protein